MLCWRCWRSTLSRSSSAFVNANGWFRCLYFVYSVIVAFPQVYYFSCIHAEFHSLLSPALLLHKIFLLLVMVPLGFGWPQQCLLSTVLVTSFSSSLSPHLTWCTDQASVWSPLWYRTIPALYFLSYLLGDQNISCFIPCIWQHCKCTQCKSLRRGNLAKTWQFGYVASRTHPFCLLINTFRTPW